MGLENKFFMFIFFLVLLVITNACTYIICSWDQPSVKSNHGAKTEVLIYIPPHETGEECQQVDFSCFTMPYFSPIYEDSTRRVVDNTLITSSTIYNTVPLNKYCGLAPFNWYAFDAANISLLYENEEIYPSKIVITPAYDDYDVDDLSSPLYGVTIERWYSLPEDIDLNKTKIRSNYMEYLSSRGSPFKYEAYEKNFSL